MPFLSMVRNRTCRWSHALALHRRPSMGEAEANRHGGAARRGGPGEDGGAGEGPGPAEGAAASGAQAKEAEEGEQAASSSVIEWFKLRSAKICAEIFGVN
ncbi:hypothetical protein ZWY2020_018289 [Hordeum vulgare]|nr:hypothetical protein ZWY2020_018289 [Hordeum vulgare]